MVLGCWRLKLLSHTPGGPEARRIKTKRAVRSLTFAPEMSCGMVGGSIPIKWQAIGDDVKTSRLYFEHMRIIYSQRLQVSAC